MPLEYHTKITGVAPGNRYSHAVAGTGEIVVIAGQVGINREGEIVGRNDPLAQIEQAFTNLHNVLIAASLTFSGVARLGLYLTSMDFLPMVRTVRDRYINFDRPPASTLVQVVALFHPELVFEVDALALRPQIRRPRRFIA